LLLASFASQAAITDVQDYSNNTPTEYFVDIDANKYNFPYYRGQTQDWGWVHNALAGSWTTATLEISAFDVDFDFGEQDTISAWDGAGWTVLGNLAGANDQWQFTTFDLSSYGWAAAQIATGLQLSMNIDAANAGWIVTLGKSTLSLDGGSQTCVPTPGVPCVASTPIPAAVWLFGTGIAGLIGFGKRKKVAA
jgi:hypothetical protein